MGVCHALLRTVSLAGPHARATFCLRCAWPVWGALFCRARTRRTPGRQQALLRRQARLIYICSVLRLNQETTNGQVSLPGFCQIQARRPRQRTVSGWLSPSGLIFLFK